MKTNLLQSTLPMYIPGLATVLTQYEYSPSYVFSLNLIKDFASKGFRKGMLMFVKMLFLCTFVHSRHFKFYIFSRHTCFRKQ